jgi:CubicO group peptidase (beta-lactamase class C family)
MRRAGWLHLGEALLCLGILFVTTPVPAARENRSPQVDALFASLEGKPAPGAAVLVVRDGAVVHRAAYGFANVELGVPNSPETVFRIASVTKQFTAMAILQLCARGKLRLDDRLAPFFPDFPAAAQITVHQVLTHTAGLPDFVSVEEAARLPLESRPGERLNYSNVGYEMLGRIIEAVSGMSYEEYLAENIFRPLKMAHTGVDSRHRIIPGRAAGYQPDGKGGVSNADYSETGKSPAAGGLYSNVDDLLRWDQALQSGALVKPETLAVAFRPATLNSGRQTGYACGWTVGTHRGLREVGHGGDISGYNAYIARYPDQRFTVIVLSNMTMRPAGPIPTAGDLAHRIAELLLSDRMAPEQPPPDVQVDSSVLDAYVGRYRLEAPKIILQNGGDLCTFTRDGNRLVAQMGPATVPLYAESEATFYSKEVPAKITFIRDGAGKVTEFILVLGGVREYRAVRLE